MFIQSAPPARRSGALARFFPVIDRLLSLGEELGLSPAAREARREDYHALLHPRPDPGADRVVDGAVAWLCSAQDHSLLRDGGVARHYSFNNGWSSSYPETTGYIVPTMLAEADRRGDAGLRERARRMLDWLVSIQLEGGGFQGGLVDSTPVVPVTFNTGQILLGLAGGAVVFGERYVPAMTRAADWLVATQDPDGCWRSHPTPFAAPGEKAYETHVSWGLFEAARVDPARGYGEAAMRNVRWALGWQRPNGWFDRCCLEDATRPLTHTIGYALRGILEAYRFSGDADLLTAALSTARGVVAATQPSGHLAGRLTADWQAAVPWACLTGSVQLAHCLFMIHEDTGDAQFLATGRLLMSHVRRTIRLDAPEGIRGGVTGSFPVDGEYGRFELLNWASKFLLDAQRLEQEITG